MKCKHCGDPIDPRADYRKVSGYERIQRVGGGTNAIALRETTDEYACRWCIEKLGRGITPEQTSLL